MIIIKSGNVENIFNTSDIVLHGAIYEVLRVINGRPVFLDDHLKRLEKSLGFKVPSIKKDILKLISLLGANKFNDNIFIKYDKSDRSYYIFQKKGFYPPENWYREGIEIGILNFKRINPQLKQYSNDYKIKIKEFLDFKKLFEVLLVDEGEIKEGSRSNVFFMYYEMGKMILKTPKVSDVLPGITRQETIKIALELDYDVVEDKISMNDLKNIEGCFITGTSINLLPINRIENYTFETTRKIDYNRLKDRFLEKMFERESEDYE